MTVTQITSQELDRMSAEQIVEAHNGGLLDDLLKGVTLDQAQARKVRENELISDAQAQRIDGAQQPGASRS